MNWAEKGLVGIGGGLRRTYLGAKDLVGQGTPDEQQELKDWSNNKEGLGGWGTAGEVVGELAATALPGAGAANVAGKVLTKALPVMKRVGQAGGRTFNLGTVGTAAVEGGVAGGVQAPGEGESRLGNAAQGAALGSALPLALAGGAPVANLVRREFGLGAKQSTLRGHAALERTLGKNRMADIVRDVENPFPSQLPRTTAAMAQDARMGALERGARQRGTADFATHDMDVDEAAWEALKKTTRSADELADVDAAPDMARMGQGLFDKLPLSQDRRAVLSQQLLEIRNSNEVIANPGMAQQINVALAALDNPSATLGVLPELIKNVGKQPSGSPAMRRVKDLFHESVDERSKGEFTNLVAGQQVTQEAADAAQAARNVRGRFMNEEQNIPVSPRAWGRTATPSAIPGVREHPLRQTLARNADKMDPDEVQGVGRLADQLAAHEIYQSKLSAGSSPLDRGAAEGVSSSAINAGPAWRMRGALKVLFGELNERSQKAIDQALLNPQDFLKMVELKKQLGRPLEGWESTLQGLLASQGSAIGSASAGYEGR
jgi:hypothetical protein